MVVWLAVTVASGADEGTGCPSSAAIVADAMLRAEASYLAFEIAGFEADVRALRRVVGCLEQPLDVGMAASVHRWLGLAAFGERDLDSAKLHFAVARTLEPGFVFDPAIAPAGSPILQVYAAHTPDPAARIVLDRPEEGTSLRIDGVPGLTLASDLPHVFQIEGPGAVQTAWLGPGEPAPLYPRPAARRGAPRVGWLTVAGALGAGALASQGIGLVRRNQIVGDLDGDPQERFDALRPNARLFNGLSIGLGVAGGGALVAGVL